MSKSIEPEGKTVMLSKVRVEPSRRDRYERAYIAEREKSGNSDLTFTDWQRLAMDARADRVLGRG